MANRYSARASAEFGEAKLVGGLECPRERDVDVGILCTVLNERRP